MAGKNLEIGIKIGAKVDGALGGLRRVSGAMGRATARVGRFGLAAGRIGARGAVALGAGAAAAAVGVWHLAQRQAAANDELTKSARRLGVSAQAYEELRHAANLSGVSAQDFDKALVKMNRNVGDLTLKQGSLYTTLKRGSPALLKQLQAAKSNEAAFELLIAAMGKLKKPSDRAALSAAAFGRSGQKMTLLVEGGAEGLAKARAEFNRLHGAIDQKALKSSEDFIDAQARLKLATGGLATTIGNRLIPIIGPMITRFGEYVGQNRELIGQKVGEVFERVATWVASIDFEEVIAGISSFIDRVGETYDGIKELGAEIERLFKRGIEWADKFARSIEHAVEKLDVFGILQDAPPTVTGDKATIDEWNRRKAGRHRVEPTPAGQSYQPGELLSGGGASQSLEGDITVRFENPPAGMRTDRPRTSGRALKLTAETGRRTAGSGLP